MFNNVLNYWDLSGIPRDLVKNPIILDPAYICYISPLYPWCAIIWACWERPFLVPFSKIRPVLRDDFAAAASAPRQVEGAPGSEGTMGTMGTMGTQRWGWPL